MGRDGSDREQPESPPGELFTGDTETVLPAGSAPTAGRAVPGLGRGALLGRYVVLHALGTGGMGIVFAAYDPELDRRVALKVLSAQVLDRTHPRQARERLLREARAAARLSHPNVVTVHDVGSVGDRLFVAMELVEGQTLGDWLRAERRSPEAVLRVFRGAGAGLAAAHRAGLVHRDFKPGNVMLNEDLRPLVLDFGLAAAAGGGAEAVGEAEGEVPAAGRTSAAGTPAYMAPEQAAGGRADARSDQFSFCVALWEALHGERPALSGDGAALAVGRRDAAVPPRVRRALERGLALDPADRFPTLDALLAELKPRSRRRLAGWVAVAALAVAAGTTLGLFTRPDAVERLCGGADRRLAGVWDDGRRAAVHAALLASGEPSAADSWGAVEASLDGYATAWAAAHTEACVATRVRGEQSEHLLDLAMACLDVRLRELRAATDLLSVADAEVAGNALRVAESPGGLGRCLDRAALTAAVPPPEDGEQATAVGAARDELAASRALRAAGKYPQALTRSEEALARARSSGYGPVEAQALVELAASQGRLGRRQEMHDSLLAALRTAQASGYDEEVARSQIFLVVSALIRGELAEAHQWGDLSGGAVARLHGDGELAAQRELFLGMLATRESDHEAAAAHYRASLALDPDLSVNERASLANNLAIAAWRLGNRDEGLVQLQRAISLYEEAYGSRYPQLVPLLVNLCDFLREDGRPGEAAEAGRRALAVAAESIGLDHPDTAWAYTSTAQALLDVGQPAAAVPMLERAVAVRELAAVDPLNLALSRFELARALQRAGGESARARRLARQALDAYRGLGPPGAEGARRVTDWLAENGAGA